MLTRFIIISFFFFACANVSSSKKDDIRGIRVTQVVPNLSERGKLLGYDTIYTDIYFHKDNRLYYMVYLYELEVEDSLVISEDRGHYVFHKKGSKYGFDFNEKHNPKTRKVQMDSLYKTDWIFMKNLYSIFSGDYKANLVSHNDSMGILKKHYYIFSKSDTTLSTQCYLEFKNQFEDLDFTLSKELDSIHGMKLQRLTTVSNPRYIKSANIYLGKIEGSWALEEIKNINQSEIKKYFDIFEDRE